DFVRRMRDQLDLKSVRPRGFYLVLQSLVAGYPLHKKPEAANLRERLHAYLEKAIREGKEMSDWADPDLDYERDLKDLGDRMLDDDGLHAALDTLLRTIWPQTRHNSFAQIILKCTVPGNPDIYQGTESWDLSFVDPDNRRPVDYHERSLRLSREPMDKYDPAQKSQLLQKLLTLRRDHREFFEIADYQPMSEGDDLLGYRRQHGEKELLVKIAKRAGTRVQRPEERGWDRIVTDDFGGGLGVWWRTGGGNEN
ncbi:MAG: hypothetical protein WA952_02480, partial [Lewinella sp.]